MMCGFFGKRRVTGDVQSGFRLGILLLELIRAESSVVSSGFCEQAPAGTRGWRAGEKEQERGRSRTRETRCSVRILGIESSFKTRPDSKIIGSKKP